MKYNYPVKYAAMPIIEQDSYSLKSNVVCYIVSKCFLLSEKTDYCENGKIEKEYVVIFPYQKGEFYVWQRVVPRPRFNSNLVEKVFDSYEEAIEFVTQKNKKLCDKTWIYLPYTENLTDEISKKIEEFNDRLSRYKLLEQQILINTSDLEQSNIKELKKLITYDKGKIKAWASSLYKYLKYPTDSKFIVYSISLEQYDKLESLLNKENISDFSKIIGNISPILYYDCEKEEEKIMVINKSGNVLYYINKWETLKRNNESTIPPIKLNAIDNETRQLFTTETIEDIVLSFNEHQYIDANKIEGPILKRNLNT